MMKKDTMWQRSKSSGTHAFTLIEVMIALVVFGIGMIVLLRAIVYFVGVSDDSKKRAQATLLAKEGMDIVYNQRDTNKRRGVTRRCAVIDTNDAVDACAHMFEPGHMFLGGLTTLTGYALIPVQSGEYIGMLYSHQKGKTVIYTHTDTFVDSEKSEKTPFVRTIAILPATVNGVLLPAEKAVLVRVTVHYTHTILPRSVILESYLAAGEKEE